MITDEKSEMKIHKMCAEHTVETEQFKLISGVVLSIQDLKHAYTYRVEKASKHTRLLREKFLF